MAEATLDSLSFSLPHSLQQRMRLRGTRKSHASIFWGLWAIPAIFLAVMFIPTFYPEPVIALYERIASTLGVSCDTVSSIVSLLILAIYGMAMFTWVRAVHASQSRRTEEDSDWTVSLTEDGLRYASQNLEYLLRWPGFHQVFAEREGLILVHGNSYFFVPNEAFENAQDLQAFVRLLAARVPPEARARSGAALAI